MGLNDWFVRVIAWDDQGEGAFIVSHLKGFQLAAAQSVVSKLVDDLRRAP
jgi:hypothetical protein